MAIVSKSILITYNKCPALAAKWKNILDSYRHKHEKIAESDLTEDLAEKINKPCGKFIDGTDPLDAVYLDGNVGIGTDTPTSKLDIQTTDPTLKRLKINDELLLDENGRLILGNPILAPARLTVSQEITNPEDFLHFERIGASALKVDSLGGIKQAGLNTSEMNSLRRTYFHGVETTPTVYIRNNGTGDVLKLRGSNGDLTKVLNTEEGGVLLSWGENAQVDAGFLMERGGKTLVYTGSDKTQEESAQFQVNSTTRGTIPFSRMTSAQRIAISLPVLGLHVTQIDGTQGVYVYKSTGWVYAY